MKKNMMDGGGCAVIEVFYCPRCGKPINYFKDTVRKDCDCLIDTEKLYVFVCFPDELKRCRGED
jgi:hypothetical protein